MASRLVQTTEIRVAAKDGLYNTLKVQTIIVGA
jgi:hypothetical protein